MTLGGVIAPFPESTPLVSATSRYVLAIVALVVVGVVGSVLVAIFRPGDNTAIVTSIFDAVLSTTTALLALMVRDTHLVVNSRMDDFKQELREASAAGILAARAAGKAEGQAEGTIQGAASADRRTDAIAERSSTP